MDNISKKMQQVRELEKAFDGLYHVQHQLANVNEENLTGYQKKAVSNLRNEIHNAYERFINGIHG